MENLNAEQVIKALECCKERFCCDCVRYFDEPREEENCRLVLLENALALIKSQEQRIKELTEENERLRADTVRKMQSAIKEYYSQSRYQPTRKNPNKHTMIEHLFNVIDLTAKEMLEGEK